MMNAAFCPRAANHSANRLRPAYHGILTKRGHAEHEGDDLHQPNRPMD
jgi:hypothetical protein